MGDGENTVRNIIPPSQSGYIRKARLEALLRRIFGKTITVRVNYNYPKAARHQC
jgi:hypothetical protein